MTRTVDVEKIVLVALDPTKCNVLVLTLPESLTPADVEAASYLCAELKAYGVTTSLIVPRSWDVRFAEVAPQLTVEE